MLSPKKCKRRPTDDNWKSESLQWPVLLIFLFWREANTPIIRIVTEVYPANFDKQTRIWDNVIESYSYSSNRISNVYDQWQVQVLTLS